MSSRSQILASRARPYDSEVEYIESTGTQWIDTGHVPTGKTRMEIDGSFTELIDSTFMGLSHNVTSEGKLCRMWFGITGSGGSHYYSLAAGTVNLTSVSNIGASTSERAFLLQSSSTESYAVAGYASGLYYGSSTSSSPSTDLSLVLFARRTCTDSTLVPVIRGFTKFRMYYGRIIEDGIVVHEYIPVRVENVGALYDCITGKLLFNSGTGSFSVGNDVSGYKIIDLGAGTGSTYLDDGTLICSIPSSTTTWNQVNYALSDLRSGLGGAIRYYDFGLLGEGANSGDTISAYVEADSTSLSAQTLNSTSRWWPTGAKRVKITKIVGTVTSGGGGGGGGGCFVEGTRIRLADGSTKRVEDISPDDELLVWNGFGFSGARPSWIMDPFVADGWFLCRFASGRTLCTAGAPLDPGHRVFSLETGRYEYEKDAIGHRVRTVSVKGQPGDVPTLSESDDTLMSVERVMHPCKAYNIITEGSYNLFAEDALTSCRLSNPGMTEDEISAYWDKLRKTGRVYG